MTHGVSWPIGVAQGREPAERSNCEASFVKREASGPMVSSFKFNVSRYAETENQKPEP